MKNYIKNTRKLIKNTIIIFILGVLLITSYFVFKLPARKELMSYSYYASIIIAVAFGIHLWMVFISVYLNSKK